MAQIIMVKRVILKEVVMLKQKVSTVLDLLPSQCKFMEMSFWPTVNHVTLYLNGLATMKYGFKALCSSWGLGSCMIC